MLKFILVLLKLKPFCLFVTQELETKSIIYSNYYSLNFWNLELECIIYPL